MSDPTPRDCAAKGASTISRVKGQINDEQLECVACGHSCRWDMTEHWLFGFQASCPLPKEAEEAKP